MHDFAPFNVTAPTASPVPVLIDSPHSGMEWPADFAPAAPREAILTTWDAFVDELWTGATTVGATLLAAQFPRAYIDVNRAVDDIDPALLAEPWSTPLNPTPYSARGMGLIRRHALPGVPMYTAPLENAAVLQRIERYYTPYRDALASNITRLHQQFGVVWHLDAHSMKSRGNAMNVDAGRGRPDVVVSDRHGTTAAPHYTRWIADWFTRVGLTAQCNDPYQGGDLVVTTGNPSAHRHSIQIEFNRALYMDEVKIERGANFAELQSHCTTLVRDLANFIASESHTAARG